MKGKETLNYNSKVQRNVSISKTLISSSSNVANVNNSTNNVFLPEESILNSKLLVPKSQSVNSNDDDYYSSERSDVKSENATGNGSISTTSKKTFPSHQSSDNTSNDTNILSFSQLMSKVSRHLVVQSSKSKNLLVGTKRKLGSSGDSSNSLSEKDASDGQRMGDDATAMNKKNKLSDSSDVGIRKSNGKDEQLLPHSVVIPSTDIVTTPAVAPAEITSTLIIPSISRSSSTGATTEDLAEHSSMVKRDSAMDTSALHSGSTSNSNLTPLSRIDQNSSVANNSDEIDELDTMYAERENAHTFETPLIEENETEEEPSKLALPESPLIRRSSIVLETSTSATSDPSVIPPIFNQENINEAIENVITPEEERISQLSRQKQQEEQQHQQQVSSASVPRPGSSADSFPTPAKWPFPSANPELLFRSTQRLSHLLSMVRTQKNVLTNPKLQYLLKANVLSVLQKNRSNPVAIANAWRVFDTNCRRLLKPYERSGVHNLMNSIRVISNDIKPDVLGIELGQKIKALSNL